MGKDRVLKHGETVVIALIPGDIAVTPGMLEYNGHTSTISRICRPSPHCAYNGSRAPYGYELEGVKSALGVPYTFTRDMLIPTFD